METQTCTRDELKKACQDASKEPENAVRLLNGWFVVARKIYPQPARVGPAWTMHYYLYSPTGKSFGGMTNVQSFASHFSNLYGWQWLDDYRANGFVAASDKIECVVTYFERGRYKGFGK